MMHPIRTFAFCLCLVFLAVGASGAQGESGGASDKANETAAPPSAQDKLSEEDLDILYAEAEKGAISVADPLAPWNKVWFHFNDKLYFWVLKPVAKGYRKVLPSPVRVGVSNFFENLTTPIRLVNCILQGKGHSAKVEIDRFLLNTVFGVGGFGDPAAKYLKVSPQDEDFGQTLGRYGIGNGIYLVWPILGPSTLRDTVGGIGDRLLNPVTYVDPTAASVGITGFRTINSTSFRIGDYESIKASTLQPYEAIRDAYVQSRQAKVEE